jgi:hypothetical protein
MRNTTLGSPALFTLIPFLFVAGFSLAIWAAVKARRKTTANLHALAERLGLLFVPKQGWFKPSARATGVLRGKPVEVFTYTTSNGKSSTTWAAVSARPAHTGGLTFTLGGRNLLTKIGEWFGRRGLTSGDAAFDAVWFARSNQPEFFSAALLSELRVKLLAAHATGSKGSFTLKDGLVKYVEVGSFYDAKRCERIPTILDIVCDLADIAEVAPDSDGAAPRG